MAVERACPHCGKPMNRTVEDTDIGAIGGWVCAGCKHFEPDDFDDDSDDLFDEHRD